MKHSNADLKALAREALNGNYGVFIAGCLLLFLMQMIPTLFISTLLDSSDVLSLITCQLLTYIVVLLLSLVQTGYQLMFLNLNRKQAFSLGNLFYPFSHHPDRFLVIHALTLFVSILLALPLEILSWKSSSYTGTLGFTFAASFVQSLVQVLLRLFLGMSDYLLLDNPEMGAVDAMKESCRLLLGNKGRLFVLQLSFVPLYMVSVFTCYLGHLWLLPYVNSTMAWFYMDLTDKTEEPEKPTIPEIPLPPIDSLKNR